CPPHNRSVLPIHRAILAKRVRFYGGAPDRARRDVAEAEHGAFWQRLSTACVGAGSRGSHGSLPEARRSSGRAGYCVSLRRPNRSASDGTSQRDESHREPALAAELFLRTRLT